MSGYTDSIINFYLDHSVFTLFNVFLKRDIGKDSIGILYTGYLFSIEKIKREIEREREREKEREERERQI